MSLMHLDDLFRADQLLLLGSATTPAQKQLLDNIEDCRSRSQRVQQALPPQPATLPAHEVAVLFEAEALGAGHVPSFVAAGCKALLWATDSRPTPALVRAAQRAGLRLLGPRSAGLIHTGHGLNLSSLPLMPPAGAVALIAQSQSVLAAAVDWAVGRGVGFSWLAATGAEADIDLADLLDHAALDPLTQAVVLQLGQIGQGRKFMSAARAVARLKPVLVLQTRRFADLDSASPDPVRSAAFRRAGLVECETLGGLFEGLAALQLLPKLPSERTVVVGNGAGVCALASDAVRRQGLRLAAPAIGTQTQIAARWPGTRQAGGSVDLGAATPEATLALVQLLLNDAGIGTVLLVHSPTDWHSHQQLAEQLAQAAPGERLLCVWLGLFSVQNARQHCTRAGLPSFASAEEAARAIHYRLQHQRNRELLGQTPPAEPALNVDGAAVGRWLRQRGSAGPTRLSTADSRQLLGDYGLSGGAIPGEAPYGLQLEAQLHPELGMALALRSGSEGRPEYGLPPFDELLAQRWLDAAGLAASTPVTVRAAMSAGLIRLGRLLIEQPLIARAQLQLCWTATGQLGPALAPQLELADPPRPERDRLALAAYPAALRHEARLPGGGCYRVRAVRPADEAAVLQLLGRLDPQEIRLRFFTQIRHFSHAMAARITQVDYDRELSLVASAAGTPAELAAIATLVADPDGQSAEFAVLVHHDHARQGLGRHLLDRVLRIARERGIHQVHGEVLAENRPMLALARSLGFETRLIWDDPGCRRVEIDSLRYPEVGDLRRPRAMPQTA